MIPVHFTNANRLLETPGVKGVEPLPVRADGRHCWSCWRLNWRERLRVLWRGEMWLGVASHQPPPVMLTATSPDFHAKRPADNSAQP